MTAHKWRLNCYNVFWRNNFVEGIHTYVGVLYFILRLRSRLLGGWPSGLANPNDIAVRLARGQPALHDTAVITGRRHTYNLSPFCIHNADIYCISYILCVVNKYRSALQLTRLRWSKR